MCKENEMLDVRTTAVVALAVMGVFTVFHILVVAGIVPYTIVWGGRISDRSLLIRMELVSIGSMMVAATVVVLRARSLIQGSSSPVLAVATWVLVALFVLNTVGNLFAKTTFEKAAFTPVTALLALLALRLAL